LSNDADGALILIHESRAASCAANDSKHFHAAAQKSLLNSEAVHKTSTGCNGFDQHTPQENHRQADPHPAHTPPPRN